MSTPSESDVADRLARALVAFQKAQKLVLGTHRKLQDLPREEADKFWAGTGARLEQHQRACATEVIAAYRLFSAEGGIAVARDRRLVNEAHQLLHEADERRAMSSKPDLKAQQGEWRTSERLRDLIHEELERRGITDLVEVGAAVGLPARDADRLMRRGRWLDGDVALLEAAAAKLGLTV